MHVGDIPCQPSEEFCVFWLMPMGTFTINYQVVVSNLSGATGHYTLKDSPAFDNDVTIINGSYSGRAEWGDEYQWQYYDG